MMDHRLIDDALPPTIHRFQIQPLPTAYNCIEYRSRLEARWAVYFDSLGLPFEYETEGFDLGAAVKYLPDFWLPTLRIWIEIKGPDPTDGETEKAHRLAVQTGSPLFVFHGGIEMPDSPRGAPKAYGFFPDLTADYGCQWCECPDCGQIGITFEGRSDRLPCKMDYASAWKLKTGSDITVPAPKGGCPRHAPNLDKTRNVATEKLSAAYGAARAMRFGR